MVMVAIKPPRRVRRWLERLAAPGAVDADSYHVTLLHIRGADLSKAGFAALCEAVATTCRTHKHFAAKIGGFGYFQDSQPKPCVWASVDSVALTDVRNSILANLKGSDVKVSDEHGFTPHMTLGYTEHARKWKPGRVKRMPEWTAKSLYVVKDDVWTRVPLKEPVNDRMRLVPTFESGYRDLEKLWTWHKSLVVVNDDLVKADGYLKHVAYQRLDPRTGKMVQVKGGRSERQLLVHKDHKLAAKDVHGQGLYRYIKREGSSHYQDDVHHWAHDYAEKHKLGATAQERRATANTLLARLFAKKALSVDVKTEVEEYAAPWLHEGDSDSEDCIGMRVGAAAIFGVSVRRDIARILKSDRQKGRKRAFEKAYDRALKMKAKHVEMMSEATALSQAAYKGQKYVTLYRGVHGVQAEALQSQGARTVSVKMDGLSSFTESKKIALNYADYGDGVLLQVKIPVRDIVISERAIRGSGQKEVIVATKAGIRTAVIVGALKKGSEMPAFEIDIDQNENRVWLQRRRKTVVVNEPLEKGRKKGGQNKTRRYLLRIEMPGGSPGKPNYRYVYPDKDDVVSFDPKTGFKLKPGRSIAKIVNEKLFGDYGVDSRTGDPYVKEGLFYAYEPRVSTSYMKRAYGEPIATETLNKVRFFKYKKVHGYTDVDLGPGVAASGYRLPQKLTQLQMTADEAAAAPGNLAKEGAVILKPEEFEEKRPSPSHDVAPVGEKSIFVAPVLKIHTDTKGKRVVELKAQADALSKLNLAEPLPDDVDPLQYAVSAIEGTRPGPGKAVVRPFKQWMIDKFGSESGLVQELGNRPATTLVTLGRFKPTQKKVLARLEEEWRGVIRGIAKRAVSAYRVSNAYLAAKASDQAAGVPYESQSSAARGYMREVFKEATQHGSEQLLRLARQYEPTVHHDDRFDKWLYGALETQIARHTKQEVEQSSGGGGTIEPIVTGDVEEAARRTAQQVDLQPDEAYELQEAGHEQLSGEELTTLSSFTGPAKATLLRALYSPDMPQSYRRVLAARLWLDSPESSADEEQAIAKRSDKGVKGPQSFERNYTGKNGIASRYKTWTDPETGAVVNLARMSQSRQAALLSKWYEAAKAHVFRQLSVPISEARAVMPDVHPSNLYANPKRVPFTEEQLSAKLHAAGHGTAEDAADLLVDVALGGGPRVLTREGAMVKRWLELETKLARGNRRLFSERTQHPITQESLSGPAPARSEKVVVLPHTPVLDKHGEWQSLPVHPAQRSVHPAVDFFASTPNQQLAQRLGIDLRHVRGAETAGGVYAHQNVSLGTAAEHTLAAAKLAHEKLLKMQSLKPARLHEKLKQTQRDVASLEKLGLSRTPAGMTWSESGHIGKFYDAVRRLQGITNTIKQKQAKVRLAKKAYRKEAGKISVAAKNPFDRKKDRLAHSVMRHILAAKPTNTQELDQAVMGWIDATHDVESKTARRTFFNAVKEHLRTEKAVSTGGDLAKHEAELQSHAPTAQEIAAHKAAADHAAKAGAALSKVKVAGKPFGKEVMMRYLSSKNPAEVHDDVRASLQNLASSVHTDKELVEFELNRRKMAGSTLVKSLTDASFESFGAAIDALDFALTMTDSARALADVLVVV